MKKFNLKTILLLFVVGVIFNSCEESPFEPEFPVVTIINQPPRVTEIAPRSVSQGFGSFEIALASFIQDQENDPISYAITNSNPEVVTAAVSNGILTITEVGLGSSTITIMITDAPGNSASTEFIVTVEAFIPITKAYFVFADFNVPDGDPLTWYEENGWEGNEFPGSAIVDGALVWAEDPANDDERYLGTGFSVDEPLDLSGNSYFSFDYANFAASYDLRIYIGGLGGGEAEFELTDLISNSPNFITFEIESLGDKILEIDPNFDLSKVIEFYILSDVGRGTFDNIRIKEIPLYKVFADFDVPDGDPLTWYEENGWEGNEFPGSAIVDGALVWAEDPANDDERYLGTGFSVDEPLDLSGNSYFSFDYANFAASYDLRIYIGGLGGGEAEFELTDLISNSPNFITFEIESLGDKILEIDPNFDLSKVIEFYILSDVGRGTFDNIIIGKN